MTDHDGVDAHGLNVLGRVDEGLALGGLELDDEKSMVSAPSRRAANEKLVRVRVEFSKNRFAQVRPARMGIFCVQLPLASLNATAASRMMFSSSAERLSRSK